MLQAMPSAAEALKRKHHHCMQKEAQRIGLPGCKSAMVQAQQELAAAQRKLENYQTVLDRVSPLKTDLIPVTEEQVRLCSAKIVEKKQIQAACKQRLEQAHRQMAAHHEMMSGTLANLALLQDM